jgi:glucosyl-dolichyl phosphate glucuronosyltransferase
MNPIISLVLCTYNNADSLKITLDQISKQRLEDSREIEVIVVNNNSSDHTQAVAEAADFGSIAYICLIEPQQGLSNARNLGVSKARGEYILFTDDDAEIGTDWVQKYLSYIKNHPADALFGKIKILWDKPQPWWYDDRYQGFFAAIDHGESTFQVKSWRHPFFGKNFCIKKSIIHEVGGFDPKLGRKGTELLGGEETAVFSYLLANQKSVWYYPDISVGHRLKDREYSVENITKQHSACAKPIIWLSRGEPGAKFFGRDVSVLKNHIIYIIEHSISYVRATLKGNVKERFYFGLELRRAVKVVIYWLINSKP